MIELDSIPSKINYIGYHRKAPKRGKKKEEVVFGSMKIDFGKIFSPFTSVYYNN